MSTWRFTTTGASVALVLVTLGCGGTDDAASAIDSGVAAVGAGASAAAATVTGTEAATTVADIVGNPDRYLGQTVTVEADVEEVLSAFAFSLDEDSPTTGGIDNDLIVFSPKSAQLASIDDQWLNNRVRVTGTVRRMTVVELERELEWDLDQKLEAEIEGTEPVLIASSVERVNAAR